jgi:hypothetical protein
MTLRRQVGRCARERLAGRTIERKHVAREAEVENDDAPLGGDEHVRRLDVAMQLASPMELAEAEHELHERRSRALRSHRAAVARRSADEIHERDAAHQLHREEAIRIVHDELVQRDEIRMGDVRQAAKLALEPEDVLGARPQHRLQRDDLVAPAILHFVDDTHAAGAERAEDGESIGAAKVAAGAIRRERGQDGGRIVSGGEDPHGLGGCGRLQEAARAIVRADQPLDLLAQVAIVTAGRREKGRSFLSRALDRGLEQLVHARPAIGVHARLGRPSSIAADGVVEPRAREVPVAIDRRVGDLHDLRDFTDGQAAEELQLDDAALARIESAQLVQRVVEDHDVDVGHVTRQIVAGERNLVGGAAFLGRMRARVTDEDAPHHDRGERDELGAVAPVDFLLIDQPHVRFVHERRRLERVVGTLAVEVASGEPAQFVVHDRQHLVTRARVAVRPFEQQVRDGRRRRRVVRHGGN